MAKVTKSSGNVFEDLGVDASESENLKLRAQLMRELEALIHNKHLTQSAAAELLGIHQSRVVTWFEARSTASVSTCS